MNVTINVTFVHVTLCNNDTLTTHEQLMLVYINVIFASNVTAMLLLRNNVSFCNIWCNEHQKKVRLSEFWLFPKILISVNTLSHRGIMINNGRWRNNN